VSIKNPAHTTTQDATLTTMIGTEAQTVAILAGFLLRFSPHLRR
jgi:hypothetical protein